MTADGRRLVPGDRVYMSGYKPAHIIRSVDRRLAYPWCADVDEFALLAVADGRPESPKLARPDRPTCSACLGVMDPYPDAGPIPGHLVRERRLARGWTQAELADALGCSPVTVSNLECGRKVLIEPVAVALAKVFGVPAKEWLRLQNLVDLERARRAA